MTQNAPLVGAAEAVPSEESQQKTSSIDRGNGMDPEASDAQDADSTTEDAADEARKAARKAAKEASEAEKAAEKAARKARKPHEKTVAREARKAADAEEAARHESGKLRFESPVGRDEVAAYFEAIVEGLRKGSLQFRQGEDALILSPPDRVEIEVKVERKSGREKLSFEIEWRTDEPEDLSILAG